MGLALALVPLAAGCGGQQQQRTAQNLCSQYKQLVAKADQVRSLDVRTATAEAIQSRADAALAKLDQLQAVTEGRYDTLISTLRTAITDVRQAAVEAGSGSTGTSNKQLQDTLQSLNEAFATLKQRLDTECTAA
ncbi:hypothetical protein [Intrasporangium oryzae]|uniref:hypothetical protein n=1 Tax=Intrasporangium oryzae TaxID=412687 RepID=UPI0004BCAF16|nr:hypothetical protein [Intrasporangium oryzae]